MRGLYIHIPFCAQKCHYCNYVIALSGNAEQREDYFKAVHEEIQYRAGLHGPLRFDTLYFGGGTPSALHSREMRYLVQELRTAFSWAATAEWTCEVNPGDVDAEKLRCYRDLGINRISLGVQSFNDDLLRRMGRGHDSRQILHTIEKLHEQGFKNISMDLINRLPGQTLEDLEYDLRRCVELGAKQIVIYDLNVHEDTAFGLWQKQGKLPLPGDETHDAMYEKIERVLVNESVFVQYEISSFAVPGYESRHNLIYWHNQEYLGFGPGAFSYTGGTRSVYAKTVKRYLDKALNRDWSNDEEERLTDEKIEIETLLTGLRLKEGIDLNQFVRIQEHLRNEVPKLAEQGLVVQDKGRLRLTSQGKKLAESVFAELSYV
jgi:oxygen-independent coproporphyrinogen-3 oxidase